MSAQPVPLQLEAILAVLSPAIRLWPPSAKGNIIWREEMAKKRSKSAAKSAG